MATMRMTGKGMKVKSPRSTRAEGLAPAGGKRNFAPGPGMMLPGARMSKNPKCAAGFR